jgi:hypothetical protein
VAVAGGERPALPGGPGLGIVVGIQEVAVAVEEDGNHGRVAQQPPCRLLGELPAVTAQYEVVEVVDVSQAGEARRSSSASARRSPSDRR